jgi:hypothetical protein
MTFSLLLASRKTGMDNRDAFDEGLARTPLARYSRIERNGQQEFQVPVRIVADGQELVAYETLRFTAAALKNLTLPHEIVRPFRVRVPRANIDVTGDHTHTVAAVRPGQRKGGHGNRDEFIAFRVNGEDFQIDDDTGRQLELDPGVELWDAGYGINLVNKKADYSDPDSPVPPEHVMNGAPFFAQLRMSGPALDADLIDPEQPPSWDNSRFVRRYTRNGPPVEEGVDDTPRWVSERKRYRCEAADNDWGAQYDMWRWEITFAGGEVLWLIESDSIPAELIRNTQNNDLWDILQDAVV